MVAPNQVLALRVFVTAPAGAITASNLPAVFEVRTTHTMAQAKTVFLSGASTP